MKTRVQGLAVEDRQAAAGQVFVGRVNTAGLGVEGAPTPVAARACGTWKPRQGPGVPSGAAGKPEVTKAQVPGGNRMPRKRTLVRRKATGNRDECPAPPLAVPHNRPDTGLLPGPERELTWAGEPLKRCGQTRRNRRASWTPC
jgi:hypothetical protein